MEHMKSYIAEFIGTCVLVLMACGVAVVLGCNTPAGYVGTALAAIVFNLFSKKSAPAQTSEQTSESEPESKEENA